ncbi:MAG: DHH family phosphoesterase [Bacilli bacterium]|nr:DHH family phosphoesterase [Bacilli bacterium]
MINFFKGLDKQINKHDNVIIIGHKDPDLDCIGASLGLYKTIEKECYIFKTIDKINNSSKKAYELLKDINFITKENYKEKIHNTLLIVVDLHRKQLLEYEEILNEIKDVIIIDHHIKSKDKIETILEYINQTKSSATEIITKYIKYKKKQIDKTTATIMLAGIEIDTNGYNMKTTKQTFLSSAWLMEMQADNILKQNILKENKQQYIKRTKQIEQSYTIGNIIICPLDNHPYNPSYLATLSEDLLRFENIEASFTIGYITPNKIGISARSLGNINVEKHMANLGGGGHLTDAACQFENKTIKEVEQILKEELNK